MSEWSTPERPSKHLPPALHRMIGGDDLFNKDGKNSLACSTPTAGAQPTRLQLPGATSLRGKHAATKSHIGVEEYRVFSTPSFVAQWPRNSDPVFDPSFPLFPSDRRGIFRHIASVHSQHGSSNREQAQCLDWQRRSRWF